MATTTVEAVATPMQTEFTVTRTVDTEPTVAVDEVIASMTRAVMSADKSMITPRPSPRPDA